MKRRVITETSSELKLNEEIFYDEDESVIVLFNNVISSLFPSESLD